MIRPGPARIDFASPKVAKLHGRALSGLMDKLRQEQIATTVYSIQHPEEVKLGPSSRTVRGEYRFTRAAFSRLSSALSTGLSNVVLDLGGVSLSGPASRKANPLAADPLTDVNLARQVWNRTVDLRFSLIRDFRLVRNEIDRTIDGVIGRQHTFVANAEFASAILQHLAAIHPLYAASLAGRSLAMWFRSRAAIAYEAGGVAGVCYPGFYFVNSENYGSMRATRAAFTSLGVLLFPFDRWGCRLSHASAEVFKRLQRLLQAVSSEGHPAAEVPRGIAAAAYSPLGFLATDSPDVIDTKTRGLLRRLVAAEIPVQFAKEILDIAYVYGAVAPDGLPANPTGPLLAQRTWLDVITVMLRMAPRADIYRRERLELAAQDILVSCLPEGSP